MNDCHRSGVGSLATTDVGVAVETIAAATWGVTETVQCNDPFADELARYGTIMGSRNDTERSMNYVSPGVATVHFTNGHKRDVVLSLPNWLSGVASDTSVVEVSSAYHQRKTQAYIGGPSTVVREDEPARVFATKIDIVPLLLCG